MTQRYTNLLPVQKHAQIKKLSIKIEPPKAEGECDEDA